MKLDMQYLLLIEQLMRLKVERAVFYKKVAEGKENLRKASKVSNSYQAEARGKEPEDLSDHAAKIEKKEIQLLKLAEEAKEKGEFLPFEYLFSVFECNDFERHTIMLLAAFEIDAWLYQLSGRFHEELGLSICFATPMLARASFDREMTDPQVFKALDSQSVGGRYFLQKEEEGQTGALRKLVLTRRLKDLLLSGSVTWQGEQNYMSLWSPKDELCKARGLDTFLERLEAMLKRGEDTRFIRLIGESGSGKSFCFKHLAKRNDWSLLLVSLSDLCWQEDSLERQIDEIIFEAHLFQAIPLLRRETLLHHQNEYGANLIKMKNRLFLRLHEEFPVLFLTAEEAVLTEEFYVGPPWSNVAMGELDLEAYEEIWKDKSLKFPIAQEVSPAAMAQRFYMTPGKIEDAYRLSWQRCLLNGRAALTLEDLIEGCHKVLHQNLGDKMVQVHTIYQWGQLILPNYQKDLLVTACNQVKYKHQVYSVWGMEQSIAYGKGISMVFAGPPGTGKTMAAQILAKEIGLELYKVELATVVSKYIGETEKNLAAIFAQARAGQFILFFDEADSLFSKRTEVKDSNDKYSNMEAAFMLQKIEEYEGITILATNYLQNFDEAFKRRMKFIIDFPFPDRESRRQIWAIGFPEKMPVEDMDLDYLSGFELSGSNIRQAILYGAFLAVERNGVVEMRDVLSGIRQEYAKQGKILSKEAMGEYYVLLS
ncbi:AAA family ATPase [Lachnospiraceae bacterium ZAX-1]